MIDLFEIGINILEEGIITLFLSLYFGCKYKGLKKCIGFCSVLFISVMINSFFTLLHLYEGIFGLAYIVIYTLYAVIFLKGDTYIKLFVSGFINCVVYFIGLFSVIITSILFKTGYNQILYMSSARIFGVIFSKILFAAACILLLKFKFNNILKRQNMVLLIIMPIITMLSMIGIMQAFMQNNELKYDLFLAAASIMLINILTYSIFIKINNDAEREAELTAIMQKYENDKQYTYDVEKLYSKTCAMRHDITHHFAVIASLLDDDNVKAKEYMQSITENQLDAFKSLIRTDNVYFDAIANTKLAVCDKIGIKVQIRFMNKSLENLQSDEIGVIFGNLFDNAIEAAKHTQDKQIELDVQKQGNRCSILMTNSISGSVMHDNSKLYTTKENKDYHGYGIKNIRRIVEKYDGIINFFEEDNCFVCDIFI